jgi:DNA-binding CsgD family transcriptional regulator
MEDENEEISEFQMIFLQQISKITNGSVYVIDFYKWSFLFVSDHDLFLSGLSTNDVLNMGYNFFQKIIHSNDLQLFIDIHRAILQFLFQLDNNVEEVDYFTFNLRLLNHGQTLMVYHKMAPIFINGCARVGLYHLSSSVIPKSGNLRIYWNDKKKYSSYSFEKHLWHEKKIIVLTNREKEILKLAMQGNCNKEIASILYVSEKTIRNIETTLYLKINVHSMCEAIIYATNHGMLF